MKRLLATAAITIALITGAHAKKTFDEMEAEASNHGYNSCGAGHLRRPADRDQCEAARSTRQDVSR